MFLSLFLLYPESRPASLVYRYPDFGGGRRNFSKGHFEWRFDEGLGVVGRKGN